MAPPTLDQAIALYQAFEEDKAQAAFEQIAAANPSRSVSAQAHVYLGLLALNRRDPALAQAELEKALRADATVDLPVGSSPKAELAFEEARQDLKRHLLTDHQLPAPEPSKAIELSSAAESAPATRSHLLSLTLGAIGLVAAGVAISAEADVALYNGQVTAANAQPTAYSGSLASAQSQANVWAIAFIPLVIVAAAAGVGSVLTW